MFLQVCVILFMVDVRGCGGACMVMGGVHGCAGACVVAGGHAWLQGVVVGGMCVCGGGMCGRKKALGEVHGWGACVAAGGACVGHDEIRSMSGRYASYWNAFLFLLKL